MVRALPGEMLLALLRGSSRIGFTAHGRPLLAETLAATTSLSPVTSLLVAHHDHGHEDGWRQCKGLSIDRIEAMSRYGRDSWPAHAAATDRMIHSPRIGYLRALQTTRASRAAGR